MGGGAHTWSCVLLLERDRVIECARTVPRAAFRFTRRSAVSAAVHATHNPAPRRGPADAAQQQHLLDVERARGVLGDAWAAAPTTQGVIGSCSLQFQSSSLFLVLSRGKYPCVRL